MGNIAIKVEGLGKQYRIGGRNASNQTFREALVQTAIAPVRWLRGERTQEETIWALDDISFEVKHGEAVGIIGRNGAGKSTLLKILSRITRPTRGRADLYGRVGSLLEVGTGFHPELTGRENIYLNGAVLGMTRQEIIRKFDEIVDFSGVEKFLDTPVKRYSSGMYVRLAFAVAAHLEPEILVVDEVLAVGDAEFQKKCLGKMGEVSHSGRTVLFVSHNMSAIKSLCSRSVYLEQGKAAFDGDTKLAVEKYKGEMPDKYVAKFLPDSVKAIRISKIEICHPNKGRIAKELDTADGLLVKIEYTVNRLVKGAHAFLRIHLDDGQTLIGTGDADLYPERLALRKTGDYKCQIFVPPNILGKGRYTITWSAGIPFQENFDVEFHALSFYIDDQKADRSNFIHRDRPGLLALNLDWQYEDIH